MRNRNDVYYQFCSEIYGLQEQMGDTDFSRISGHLDIVSKSLKIVSLKSFSLGIQTHARDVVHKQ